MRDGTYPQSKALVFTPADSGTAGSPVTYAAYAGEHPVISGGAAITGWQPDDSAQSRTRCNGRLWRVDLPAGPAGAAWRFNQLFVNGQRRPRARIPNQREFLRAEEPASKGDRRSFYFKAGDLKEWSNPRDILLVVYHSWETSIHHIESLDTEANRVVLREPAPWALGEWEKQQRYYVENVFEGLDTPGEWYLDPTAGRLYYYPLPGETMTGIGAVAPWLTSTLIEFKGEPVKGAFVEHLHFRGIAFRHTSSQLRRIRNPGQGELYQPGLIQASGLRHASFEGCEIAHSGAHGAWIGEGCSDVRLERCHLRDLGGGGVYIGGGWGINEAAPTRRITVENCFIHDGSHQFHGSHGVWIGTSSDNTVTHNEISDFDYSGISCGWSWGFQPSSANHNVLDYNHIHHLGNGDGLSDMGGIYTLGVSPGTTERNNHIHDVFNYAPVSHGSGIYPDEGSSDILIENNVVYRVRTCPLFQHYGKDNTIRNNIFALGGEGQLQRCREDIPCHYVAEGNIVYAETPKMLGGIWKSGNWKLERNLYWSTSGAPVFAGLNFAAWQAKGNDTGSIIADPLFVNPGQGDFRLRPNSPALTLGFRPIDLGKTGLRGDPAWVLLPKQYPNRSLKEVPPPVQTPFIVNLDFESELQGVAPPDGVCLDGENGASIRVSTDTAAGGRQSLKFTDAPGQKYSWTPHLYYRKTYTNGSVLISWDMLNRKDAPASFFVEARQYNDGPYVTGPTVAVAPNGKVTAGGREVGVMPLGEWVRVEIAMALGKGSPGTYQLVLRVPGREPVTRELPCQNSSFREIHWLGICSTTEAASCFYIDNLRMGTAEELAQPPKHRPRTRPVTAREQPQQPANNQGLAGYWTFDESDAYTARDHSGSGNTADVWASWAKGAFGTALLCDPAAHTATVRDAPTLRFGTGDFSVELWLCPTTLKIDSKDPRRRFMSKDHNPEGWWNLNVSADGRPFIEMRDSNKAMCANRPAGTIPENAWTHLVVVVDRASVKTRYYYNGTLDSAQNIPAGFTGKLDVEGGDLSIGSNWQPFIGLLDEVKIYRRVLGPEEIQASYQKEKGRRGSVAYEVVE
ncbi:MAG: LamG-like jellyroll fold domain-containing protein [Limisphaerales bacterium]